MNISWGVYVRFGRTCLTKTCGSLRQARQRYDRLTARRKRPNTWFALIPIHGELVRES